MNQLVRDAAAEAYIAALEARLKDIGALAMTIHVGGTRHADAVFRIIHLAYGACGLCPPCVAGRSWDCERLARRRAASRCASVANEPPTGQPYPEGGNSDFPMMTPEQTEQVRRKYQGERR